MAKKHVCRTVLVRPLSPAASATASASMAHGVCQALLDDLLLHRAEAAHTSAGGRRVEQHPGARPGDAEDVDPVEQAEVVHADEAGLADQVGSPDRVRPEAQVRDGLTARLLRVVDEVGLGVHVGVGTEDLDRVLVRPDRAVRADAVEDGPQRLVVLDVEVTVIGQARPAHVVVDADREPGALHPQGQARRRCRRPCRA